VNEKIAKKKLLSLSDDTEGTGHVTGTGDVTGV